MPRTRLAALLLILAAVAAGTPTGHAPPGPALLLGGVPDVTQKTDYSCGPAALTAVLAYYGIALTEAEVVREAGVNPEVGAEMEDLAAVAARRGLDARVCQGLGLADLARELRAGRPVIVLNQSWRDDPAVPWGRDWDDGHYLVVIGLDAEQVYVEDPHPELRGKRGFIPRAEFVERWHGWTFDQRQAWGQGLLIGGKRPVPGGPVLGPWERVP